MNFPLESFIAVSAANPWTYLVFGLIGFAFGYTLEMSGFGDSRKLAAQFYFTEMTVLKVMFTAIVTAMVLLFGAVGLGIYFAVADLLQNNPEDSAEFKRSVSYLKQFYGEIDSYIKRRKKPLSGIQLRAIPSSWGWLDNMAFHSQLP